MTKTSIPRFFKNFNQPNLITWLIYAALLGVLLPHTAWAFAKFEPSDGVKWLGIHWIAWLLAIVFELALGVFTHKLALHNSSLPSEADFTERYWNVNGAGLFVAWLVSTAANLAHSFEFAQPFIITENNVYLFTVYKLAFGAVLPLMSALFARVLFTTHAAPIQPPIIVKSSVKPAQPKTASQAKKSVKPSVKESVKSLEKQLDHIANVYNSNPDVNKAQLARELSITRPTLNKRIDQAKAEGKIIEPLHLNGHANEQ